MNLGIGSSAPFATNVETEAGWAGRYHLRRARMIAMNGQAALAWQVTPWLALAGGLQVQRFETKFGNAALIPSGGTIVEGHAYLQGRPSWAVGGIGGVMLTPVEGTRIGVGWRSAMTHHIRGQAASDIPGTAVEQLRFDLDLPQVVTLGIEQRVSSSVRVFAEVQSVEWSRFKGFDISFASGRANEVRPIEWKDTRLYAVGLGLRMTPDTEITAGASFDEAAAVNASGTTLSADASKVTLGLGLIQEVPGLGQISLSYAHVLVNDARVFASQTTSGTLEGQLGGRIDTFGAGLTIRW